MIAWIMGSRVGQWIASAVALATVIWLLLWRVFAAGQRAEVAKQTEATLENVREREKSDEAIAVLSDTERRHHLREWVSGNGEQSL